MALDHARYQSTLQQHVPGYNLLTSSRLMQSYQTHLIHYAESQGNTYNALFPVGNQLLHVYCHEQLMSAILLGFFHTSPVFERPAVSDCRRTNE